MTTAPPLETNTICIGCSVCSIGARPFEDTTTGCPQLFGEHGETVAPTCLLRLFFHNLHRLSRPPPSRLRTQIPFPFHSSSRPPSPSPRSRRPVPSADDDRFLRLRRRLPLIHARGRVPSAPPMISARMRSFSPRSASIFARSVSLLTAADELARAGTAVAVPSPSVPRLVRPTGSSAADARSPSPSPSNRRSRALSLSRASVRPRGRRARGRYPLSLRLSECVGTQNAREARRRAASIAIARGDASRESARARRGGRRWG